MLNNYNNSGVLSSDNSNNGNICNSSCPTNKSILFLIIFWNKKLIKIKFQMQIIFANIVTAHVHLENVVLELTQLNVYNVLLLLYF